MPAKSRRLVYPLFLTGEEWEMREYATRPTGRRAARPSPNKPANSRAAHGRIFHFAPPPNWGSRLRTGGSTLRAFRAAAAGRPDLMLDPVGRLLAYRIWLLAWDYPYLVAPVGTSLPSTPARVLLAAGRGTLHRLAN